MPSCYIQNLNSMEKWSRAPAPRNAQNGSAKSLPDSAQLGSYPFA